MPLPKILQLTIYIACFLLAIKRWNKSKDLLARQWFSKYVSQSISYVSHSKKRWYSSSMTLKLFIWHRGQNLRFPSMFIWRRFSIIDLWPEHLKLEKPFCEHTYFNIKIKFYIKCRFKFFTMKRFFLMKRFWWIINILKPFLSITIWYPFSKQGNKKDRISYVLTYPCISETISE